MGYLICVNTLGTINKIKPMDNENHFFRFGCEKELALELCLYLEKEIARILKMKKFCNIMVPGGNSPIVFFKQFSKSCVHWEKVKIFLSDERFLPKNHTNRNDKNFSDNFSFSGNHPVFHNIPVELGLDKGISSYRKILDNESMDIVVLGLGEDGHIASLFPNCNSLNSSESCFIVRNSAKLPKKRISVGMTTIRRASKRIILVIGKSKRKLLEEMHPNPSKPFTLVGNADFYIA